MDSETDDDRERRHRSDELARELGLAPRLVAMAESMRKIREMEREHDSVLRAVERAEPARPGEAGG